MDKPPGVPRIPGPGEGKRGEEGYLGYLLRQASAAYRLRMERALADLGVTAPQFAILTMLVAYPGASGADLARLALLTPQTMSVILRNLERAGLVARRRHEAHGRIRQVEATEAGRALLARCRERVQALERSLTEGLPAADERAIRRWLAGLAREPRPEPRPEPPRR